MRSDTRDIPGEPERHFKWVPDFGWMTMSKEEIEAEAVNAELIRLREAVAEAESILRAWHSYSMSHLNLLQKVLTWLDKYSNLPDNGR